MPRIGMLPRAVLSPDRPVQKGDERVLEGHRKVHWHMLLTHTKQGQVIG